MITGNTYTRRICAVLLADVSGFSAMMGEDAEGTARAVRGLTRVVEELVAKRGGQAEARAGDAILATFDSVAGAVEAALEIQQLLATERFESRRLQMSIGVHFGDVIWQEDLVQGDAINIAARLQSLARPGTICISDSVHRQVKGRLTQRVEDLGVQRLKHISDPIHAYLVVPTGAATRRSPPLTPRWNHRWIIGGAMSVGVLVGAVIVAEHRSRPEVAPVIVPAGDERGDGAGAGQPPPGERTEQVRLGVMIFKLRGGDEAQRWIGDALRDGLNAQLSRLAGVKVYSKEFIDFLITRKKLSELEAATQLGVQKMLLGSFVIMGDNLQVETHIVDVETGVIDAAYTAEGSRERFFDLQNEVTLEVIAGLSVPMSADERHGLLSERGRDVEALRLLLEAEGAVRKSAPPKSKEESGHSWLLRWVTWPPPRSAWASNEEEVVDSEAEIREVLERYRSATENRSLEELATLYVEYPEETRAAQQRYFDNVKDLHVVIDDVDVAVVGDEAVVSYTRTDDFLDARTGRPMHVSVRLTKTLRRHEGGWRMASSE